ncbi:hypothetical protein F2Q69_00063957 [Brassica cretica]|uniref:Uncharacterized protein n=1 Tax=Brassica cretica TaxID=69181 RepID=A0A8S9SDS6_BRACR|nr:hypothetical protein F2Q69_00063957 [Brassica cretica]
MVKDFMNSRSVGGVVRILVVKREVMVKVGVVVRIAPVQRDHVFSRPPPSSFSVPPSRSVTGNEETNDSSRHHHQFVTPSPSVITSPFFQI